MTDSIINKDEVVLGFQEYCDLMSTVAHVSEMNEQIFDWIDYDADYSAHVLFQACQMMIRRFDELKATQKKVLID